MDRVPRIASTLAFAKTLFNRLLRLKTAAFVGAGVLVGFLVSDLMSNLALVTGVLDAVSVREPARLAVGTPSEGVLTEPGEVGVGVFQGERGQAVSVAASSAAFNTFVRLVTPAGEEIVSDDDSGHGANSLAVADLPMSGQYRVEVTAVSEQRFGAYEVAVHTVEPLEVNTPTDGVLTQSDKRGLWVFEGREGQVVAVTAGSESFDSAVWLLSPTGEEIASDNDSGPGTDSLAVAVLPFTGKYQVWIGTLLDDGVGAYEVTVTNIEPPRLEMNATPSEGALTESGEGGLWVFEGEQGQAVSLAAGSEAFDTVVRLLSPTAMQIARDNNSGHGTDSSAVAVLPVAGQYVVQVTSRSGEDGGAYEVAVRTIEPEHLELNTASEGEITESGEGGVWVFNGEQGQTVGVVASSQAFDTAVRLQSPTDAQIAWDNNSGPGTNSSLVAILPASGQYVVQVTSRSDEGGGAYGVAVRTIEPRHLDVNIATDGELPESGAGGLWAFDGEEGQTIGVAASSEDFDTFVRLLSPTGEEIASDDDGGPGTDSLAVSVLPASGKHQVRVTALGEEGGAYQVGVRAIEPGHLEIDAASRGKLAASDEEELWVFDGMEGQTVSVSASSEAFDTVVRLLSSNGEEIASDDDSGRGTDSLAVAVLSASAEHLVQVTAVGGGVGDYEVAVRAGGRLEVDRPAEGELTHSDEEGIWVFEGMQGQEISLAAGSEAFDTVIRVLSPNGEEIAWDDDGGGGTDALAVVILPRTGKYQARVTSLDGAVGAYEVALGAVELERLDLNTPSEGKLAGSGETGLWVFEGMQGQAVSVTARSETFDTVVRLISPTGEEIARDDDGSSSLAAGFLPSSGQYRVEVTALSDAGFGDYEVAVRAVEPAMLRVGTPSEGELTESRPEGVWALEGVEGQVVVVAARSEALDTVVRLVSPAGEEIAWDDDSGPGTDSLAVAYLPSSGRYLVRVAFLGEETGTYEVVVHTVATGRSADSRSSR